MNIGDGGLLLVGCGKMGGALLRGWLSAGLRADQVAVLEPRPSAWLTDLQTDGLHLNQPIRTAPAVVVLATKPQIMAQAIPDVADFGNGSTLFISIAAGTPVSTFLDLLGSGTPVIRAMPNTPASVRTGVSALFAAEPVTSEQMELAVSLLNCVGETVILQDEEDMHTVTALSGSGPAYVFAMTEALAEAGVELGLKPEVAAKLAVSTVSGAGKLMRETGEAPATLREMVTSPNGTTAAGLEVLMETGCGIQKLARETLSAAANRSKELASDEVQRLAVAMRITG